MRQGPRGRRAGSHAAAGRSPREGQREARDWGAQEWAGPSHLSGSATWAARWPANLVKAGHEVKGLDLVGAAARGGAGARRRDRRRMAAAVAGADIVVTMLPAGRHVVRSGGAKILPSLTGRAADRLLDDRRRQRPRGAHAMAAKRGCLPLDAPVSGGVGGARGRHADLHGRRRRARPSPRPSRCSQAWAGRSCIAARRAPGRPPRSATT